MHDDGSADHDSALLLADPEALPASLLTLKVRMSRTVGSFSGKLHLLAMLNAGLTREQRHCWRGCTPWQASIQSTASPALIVQAMLLRAAQEAYDVNMADTAHCLGRYKVLYRIALVQPEPRFVYAAQMATLPATLRDLSFDVFTPVKARLHRS